ncbi:MAG: MraY family glycosyltransferase [Pseudomonadota bacterium]
MILPALLVFLFVLISVPTWCHFAPRLGLIDTPDARKVHEGTIPSVGGLAIFSVLLPFFLLLVPLGIIEKTALTAAFLILLIVGALDDRTPVNARIKFALHFLAVALVVWGSGMILHSMGNLFGLGVTQFGWFAGIFTLACGVYMINAMNMMDGMDGLGAGIAFVMIGWLLILAVLADTQALALLCALSLAALAGFLWYNMRHRFRARATVFLGDAGSMSLGLLITFLAVRLSQDPMITAPPIVFAFIVALPIWDAFGLLIMRWRAGRPPFSPDNGHFHHHFLAAGYTPAQATPLILSYAALLGAVGVLLSTLGVPEVVLTALWVTGWIGHTFLTCCNQGFIRFLRHLRGHAR